MTYFKNIKNLEELRKEYRKLLKQYHPDNGGSEEITKIINLEYEQLFEQLKNSDAKENNWKYNKDQDDLFKSTLNKVVNFEGVTVEIIGCWIWLTGNTYNYKEDIKAAGFKWCGKKKAWSWHAGEKYYKKSKRALSMDEIRNMYGSETVQTHGRAKITA